MLLFSNFLVVILDGFFEKSATLFWGFGGERDVVAGEFGEVGLLVVEVLKGGVGVGLL